MRHPPCSVRSAALAVAGAGLLLCAGCATPPDRTAEIEQMLAAAGFHIQPADTLERARTLETLPPGQLYAEPRTENGKRVAGYVYADPKGCGCVYVGDETAYQAFERLVVQKRIADEHLRAAMLERDVAWGAWGPGFWGPW